MKKDKGKEIRRAPPPWRRDTTQEPYFQADGLCWHHCRCFADPRTTGQVLNIPFKSGPQSMSCCLSPATSSSESPSSFHSCQSALEPPFTFFLENKVMCWKQSTTRWSFPTALACPTGCCPFPFAEKTAYGWQGDRTRRQRWLSGSLYILGFSRACPKLWLFWLISSWSCPVKRRIFSNSGWNSNALLVFRRCLLLFYELYPTSLAHELIVWFPSSVLPDMGFFSPFYTGTDDPYHRSYQHTERAQRYLYLCSTHSV